LHFTVAKYFDMARWIFALQFTFLASIYFLYASENPYLDSLKHVEKNTRNDSLRLDALRKLAIAYSDSTYEKSFFYWKQALAVATKHKNRPQMAHIHHQIGYVLFNQGEFKSALLEYNNALAVHQFLGDKSGIGQLYNDIGLIYKNWAQYEEAIDNFLNALREFDIISDDQGIGMVANNIGQIYFYRGEYANAIKYFDRYLEINQKNNRLRAVAGASNNIAAAYMELKSYDLALNHFKLALSIYDSLGIQVGVGILSDNIGMLYANMGNYVQSLKYHYDAQRIFNVIQSQTRLSHTFKNIGFTFYKLGDYEKSIDNLVKALSIAKKYNQREVEKEILFNLSNVYEANNQLSEALSCYKNLTLLKDSLLNEETAENISALEMRYESEKKDRELSFLQSKIEHQYQFRVIIISAILLALLIVVLLTIENYRKKTIIQKLMLRKKFLYETLEHTVRTFVEQPNIYNQIPIRVIPFNSGISSSCITDVIILQTYNSQIIVTLCARNAMVNFGLVKAFLYNELKHYVDFNKDYIPTFLVDQINSKLLFIRRLFDIPDNDLFHNYLLIECNRESISHWGNSSVILLERDQMVKKISKSLTIDFNQEKATLYMVAFSPEVEPIEEFESYLSKTIESMEFNAFDQKAEVINSAIDSWSFNSEIFSKVLIVLVDINCSNPINFSILNS
jgi:tetratricopeptide (TPR) repeat protein